MEKESIYLVTYIFKKKFYWLFGEHGFGRIQLKCNPEDLSNIDHVEQIENEIIKTTKCKDAYVLNIIKLS